MAKHLIKIEHVEHGVLSVEHLGKDMQWCENGVTVQVHNQPDTGWGLQQLYYMVGNSQTKNNIDIETMRFTMPNDTVTIGGVFKRFVVGDWTEEKGKASGNKVFMQGENKQPVAVLLSHLVSLITDSELSEESENPVQNKVVTLALALKQALLVSGVNIKTINGMSILGNGNLTVGGSDTSLAQLGFAAFDTDETYHVGDVVVYDNGLWIFTADHSGAWDAEDADPTDLLQLLATAGIDVTAEDITPKSNTMQEFVEKFAAQTTGGDNDLKTGASALLNIKGNLDAQLNPFNADSFVSTAMNLVDAEQYITIVGKKSYIFPVVAGNWGAYGTTQENNGYIVIGGDIEGVYYSAVKPIATSYGSDCDYHDHDGKRYYLPSGQGWLTIVCNSDVVPACHIAWSNYNDTVAGVFGNTVKNIAADVQAIHAWGMALVQGNGKTVFDELDYANGKRYKRTDRAALASLTYTKETIEGEGGNTYVYRSTISAMAANGAWACKVNSLEMESNTIVIRSSTISTVEDLQTSLAGEYIYYELASVVSSNTSTTTTMQANDFGLTYFMLSGELVTVAAYVTEGFYQGGKDQLFNAVTYQKILAEVLAAAVCQLDSRLLAIEQQVAEGFNYLKVTNLEVTRKLTQPA